VIVTHDATDAQLSSTVVRLRGLGPVREVSSVMRVEGTAD
jgi:homoserine dehydrogenase